MIDPHLLTQSPELVRAHLKKRHAADALVDVDQVVALAATRLELVTERDGLRAQRNTLSRQIGQLMREGKADEAEAIKAQVAEGNTRIGVLEEELKALEAQLHARAMRIPNLLHESVPEGSSDADNRLIHDWGTKPSIEAPQDHVELGAKLGVIDLERSSKLSGARFAILQGAGARMERALINLFLDMHTGEHGYTEVMVPYIVHRHCAEGTGQLPKFEHDMFRLQGELNGHDAFLIPTAEVPVTNIHRDEILEEAQLPLKYVSFTPCFRSEAGSAGRDTRGLIRQHQFHKVELVWITTPEQGEAAHHSLRQHAEAVLQRLELPYRVMQLCGGDTGFAAHNCFDLEVWLPSQGAYREISSVSHFTDFQARRMQLRYRPEPVNGKKQKPRYAHTLNGSGLAVGRTLVAILENYQQADGTVIVPPALRPYMGGLELICPEG